MPTPRYRLTTEESADDGATWSRVHTLSGPIDHLQVSRPAPGKTLLNVRFTFEAPEAEVPADEPPAPAEPAVEEGGSDPEAAPSADESGDADGGTADGDAGDEE